MMPRQLQRGLLNKCYSQRSEPRPLAECLPRINVNDLKIPRDYKTYTASDISLRYPEISGLRISAYMVEFHHNNRIQAFRFKWIKTGFGYPRPAFICQCGRPVISLYLRHTNLSCRRCSSAVYASQTLNQYQRPVLRTHRIKQYLRFKPSLTAKTKQRLQARISTSTSTLPKRISDKALLPQSNYQVQALPLWS
jgi:hypothetical protein